MISVNKLKLLNEDGDYYFCNLCNTWHRFRTDSTSLGNRHIANFDENETNSQSPNYFFCGPCGKWHTAHKKDHLQYRIYIQRDPNLKPVPPLQPSLEPSSTHSHHTASSILASFDGATDLRKNESGNVPEPFLINSINNSVPLKLINKIKIKSKAQHCFVKFIDNQLLYKFGIQKSYSLIKISNITDTDWSTHYEMEKALSNFEIGSYSRYLTVSSNFIAVWSNAVESKVFKLRVFNNAGEFLWDYDVKNISQRSQMVAISISDTGLILYAVRDTAYLISKDKKELLAWECPKEPIKEDEDMEDSDKIYSDNAISIYAKVTVDPFNDIRALEISRDSRCVFLGCYSGDVFCLNLEKQVIWHHKINSHQINEIISSNDGENLVIKSEDGYIYFIEKGEILNKYKLMNRWILGEYHNTKQQFFISDGKDFSIFDKSGTLLSKIIFKNDVNWFDISEKLNAVAIASSDGIDIFSI
jgi:hypothetical protein